MNFPTFKIPMIVKKWVMVLGMVTMFGTGFMATNVVTSCKAQAQCICGICIYAFSGISITVASISAQIGTALAAVYVYLPVEYGLKATTGFAPQIIQAYEDVNSDIIAWFDTFWFYHFRPALQAMTEQLNVIDAEQTRQLAALQDAAELMRIQNLFADMDIDSRRGYTAGEGVCSAGTVASSMTRVYNLRKSYGRAAPLDQLPRDDNQEGSPAQYGPTADLGDRWNTYLARYCRADANGGAAGCTTDAPFADMDLDVTGMVFQKDTIDFKGDPEIKTIIDDLIRNIANPVAIDTVPPDVVGTGPGNEALLKANAYKAKRQMVVTALNHVVARRFPGSAGDNPNGFLQQMRGAAGLSAVEMSSNPSYNEIMDVMMSERFRTGDYGIQEVDEPENNAREMVIQHAFQVMQMSDYLDILDQYGMVLAIQAGMEAAQVRPLNAQVGSRDKQ